MDEDGGQETGAVRVSKAATFRAAQLVCIRMEKMRFAKAAELNFSTERRLQVVYELENLNGTPIDGQYYC